MQKSTYSSAQELIGLDMVYIPGGSFMMGSPGGEGYDTEKPQHRVTVEPFCVGKYPITQRQYQEIMNSNPSNFRGDNLPVENVSWEDAVEFCQRLSLHTGQEYRLPSEAEWEYACRAGTTTPFHFGETITEDLANYAAVDIYAIELTTTPVASFAPNPFGLYDMHGNVWEWCQDDWHDNYEDAPTDGSAWISENHGKKVFRGGSWFSDSKECRSASRFRNNRAFRGGNIGFRVVCVAPSAT